MSIADKYFLEHDLERTLVSLSALLEYHRKHPEAMTPKAEELTNAIFDKIVRLQNRSH